MTPPSPTAPLDDDDLDYVMPAPSLPQPPDQRWHCRQCGGLTLLDEDDLCSNCWSERVASFVEVCTRALNLETRKVKRRWWIR